MPWVLSAQYAAALRAQARLLAGTWRRARSWPPETSALAWRRPAPGWSTAPPWSARDRAELLDAARRLARRQALPAAW